MGVATSIIAGSALAAAAGLGGAAIQADSAGDARNAQLRGQLEAIKAQRALTEKGYGIFRNESNRARSLLRQETDRARKDLQPLRDLGLKNLRRLDASIDPNSAEAQAERSAFQRVLSQNLAARGLTGSGAEIAGLGDFELGLARERRNTASFLGGLGNNAIQTQAGLRAGLGQQFGNILQNLGQGGGSLFSNLGANIGNTITGTAQNVAQTHLAGGQALAQGLATAGNAAQIGIGGLAGLGVQQQNQAFQQQLLQQYLGGAK